MKKKGRAGNRRQPHGVSGEETRKVSAATTAFGNCLSAGGGGMRRQRVQIENTRVVKWELSLKGMVNMIVCAK